MKNKEIIDNKNIIKNVGELRFSKLLDRYDLQYIYQPKVQVLKQIGYTPDFFVLANNSFYEVIGSRQAFNSNRKKILLAQSLVNFFIVKPDGMPYKYRQINKDEAPSRRGLVFFPFDIRKLLFLTRNTVPELTKKLELKYTTKFYNALKNKRLNIKHINKLRIIYGDTIIDECCTVDKTNVLTEFIQ